MSDAPSWLTDDASSDVAESLAKNPHVQAAANKAAKDPRVQKAVYDAAVSQATGGATPSWAANDGGGGGGSSPYTNADDVEVGGSAVNPHTTNMAAVPAAELEKMKGYHNMLRMLYIGTSIFMSFVAVSSFLTGTTDLFQLCFSFYVFIFAVLICCFEAQLFGYAAKTIAVNFGFMYSLIGRWFFLLFVGFMCYNLGTLGIVCMGLLYAGGLGHAIMLYKFPFFTEYQRMLHFDMHKK